MPRAVQSSLAPSPTSRAYPAPSGSRYSCNHCVVTGRPWRDAPGWRPAPGGQARGRPVCGCPRCAARVLLERALWRTAQRHPDLALIHHDEAGLSFGALQQASASRSVDELEAAFGVLITELGLLLARLLGRKLAKRLWADHPGGGPPQGRWTGAPPRTRAVAARSRMTQSATGPEAAIGGRCASLAVASVAGNRPSRAAKQNGGAGFGPRAGWPRPSAGAAARALRLASGSSHAQYS